MNRAESSRPASASEPAEAPKLLDAIYEWGVIGWRDSWRGKEFTDACKRLVALSATPAPASDAPEPDDVRRLSGWISDPRDDARAVAHVEVADAERLSPEAIGWTGSGATVAEALANLGRALYDLNASRPSGTTP